MNREAVFINEKKENIEKIKNKYKNMQMSDDAALKVSRLEATNKILKTATTVVGIITAIDFFVPDPVLGLDEVALTALTGLFKISSTLVENKIDSIAKGEDASLQASEVANISMQMNKVLKSVKKAGFSNVK